MPEKPVGPLDAPRGREDMNRKKFLKLHAGITQEMNDGPNDGKRREYFILSLEDAAFVRSNAKMFLGRELTAEEDTFIRICESMANQHVVDRATSDQREQEIFQLWRTSTPEEVAGYLSTIPDYRLQYLSSSVGTWGQKIQNYAKTELARRDAEKQRVLLAQAQRVEDAFDSATTQRVDPTAFDLNVLAQHMPTRQFPKAPKKKWWQIWK